MRKTLTDKLARRILTPVAGDLLIDLQVWCGRQDMETALKTWASFPAASAPATPQSLPPGR